MKTDLNTRIARVKEENRIEDVARDLGLDLSKKGRSLMAHCPVPGHEDKNASFSINAPKGLYKCFGCGAAGDVINLVRLLRGGTVAEALEYLEERAGLNGDGRASREPAEKAVRRPGPEKDDVETLRDAAETHRILTDLATFLHRRLPECPEALEYLSTRGLYSPEVVRHFMAGYDDGTAVKALPDEDRKILREIGYLNSRGKPAFYKMIVVPLFRGEKVVGLYGRRTTGTEPLHRYLAGRHRGVVNPQALSGSSELVLAEKPLDALSAFLMGVPHASCTFGATGFGEDLVELVRKNVKVLYLAQDADAGGEAGVKKALELFGAEGITCRRVRLPKGTNDLNDLLTRYGVRRATEIFSKNLEEAPPLAGAEVSGKTSYEGMLSLREGHGQFRYGGVHYRAWPIPFAGRAGELKLVVRAEKNGAEHTDRFNLYSSASRARFGSKAAEKLVLQPARIEVDLSNIVTEIEAFWERRGGKRALSGPEAAGGMSHRERDGALELLRDPHLLDRIDRDLDLLGYVGERANKILAYLIGISRKMESPLGAVIKSSSSSGKTRLMERIAELCPPEEVEYLSRISSKALYYLPDDYLNGRLLVLDEAAGANEDVEYCIRQILSRRVLSAAIVQTNPSTGRLETLVFHKQANSAYMEATTSVDGQNVENENRVFVLSMDESEEQTTRIHEAQKRRAWEKAGAGERIVEVHRNAQRLLRPMRVEIPFVDEIRFPAHWLRTRRDHERFLALVAAAAFLFQYQRRVGADGSGALYVEASPDDYARAYEIARDVLVEGLSELGRGHRELLGHVEKMVGQASEASGTKPADYLFTRAQIREYAGWPHHQVRNLIRRLEELEIVQVASSRNGTATQYRLRRDASQNGGDPLSGLTTPQQLGAILRNSAPRQPEQS